jgi:general secretion pathway protein J
MTARRSGGFTLIEMLVALALVSLMSVAMLQAYRFSQRTLSQATRLDGGVREVAGAQRLLRRLIEQAYPFEGPASEAAATVARPLEGGARELALSAPSLARAGAVGLVRYTLAESDGALEVRWSIDRNGAADAVSERREALLDGVAALSIDYLELVRLDNGQFEPLWRESWTNRHKLPALVRVRVQFAPGDRRQWPELVVAPRISADANCVFDVVSQMCRMES